MRLAAPEAQPCILTPTQLAQSLPEIQSGLTRKMKGSGHAYICQALHTSL